MSIMKNLLISLGVSLCLCFAAAASEGGTCKLKVQPISQEWSKMVKNCTDLLQDQVQLEITASMTYLAMGAHFSRDTVNRPGFADFFFKAAGEERQHAIKILEYLLMRGQLTQKFSRLVRLAEIKAKLDNNLSVVDALKKALDLETRVTASIRRIMDECESPTEQPKNNDYHLVDWLTTDFLDEQYKGQRDLAGRISTLQKMITKDRAPNAPLAEFLYDKKLLRGEI